MPIRFTILVVWSLLVCLGQACSNPKEEEGINFDEDDAAVEQGIIAGDRHLYELSAKEERRVAVLREMIGRGLLAGREVFASALKRETAKLGISYSYPTPDPSQHAFYLNETVPECPFLQYYDNGWQQQGPSCDAAVGNARVQCFLAVDAIMAKSKLPDLSFLGADVTREEMSFWYEQGVLSAFEEGRVYAKVDMKHQQVCDWPLSPVLASYDAGWLLGRQLLQNKLNLQLEARGFEPEYPLLAEDVDVCNAQASILLPAKLSALEDVALTAQQNPLCADYVPTTQDGATYFEDARELYAQGIRDGVNDEFELASVVVYKNVSCNVSDPLVLDLGGDGVELLPLHRGVNFDLTGSGRKLALSWPGPAEGILVADLDGDGLISTGRELLAVSSSAALALAELDLDGDGLLGPADPLFGTLAIWVDGNSDGRSAPGELQRLATLGIDGLRLECAGTEEPKAACRAGFLGFGPRGFSELQLSFAPNPSSFGKLNSGAENAQR